MDLFHPSIARTMNRLRVLNLIALEGPISRADIARKLELSKPSTSEVVALLLEENLIEEGGKEETRSGRKPTALMLKSEGILVLGIAVEPKAVSYAIANINGSILRMEKAPLAENPDPKSTGQAIIQWVRKRSTLPIRSIVITTSGTFDEERKTLLSHEYLPWENIPLAEAIEAHTHIPTVFAHTAIAMSFAERWYAAEELPSSYLYLSYSDHFEAATYINSADHLSRFAHTPVRETGLCTCGSIGCIATLSGEAQAKAIGKALIAADRALNVDAIIIAGNAEYLGIIKEHFHGTTPIIQSSLKDPSPLLGAIAVALDWGIFKRSSLEKSKTATQNG